MRKLIFILIFLMFAVPVYSETLYVSETGDGSNPSAGVEATAFDFADFRDGNNWDTGDNKISPGDTVLIMGSGTIRDYLEIKDSGTSGNLITIQPETAGALTLSGADVFSPTWVSAPLGVIPDDFEAGSASVDWNANTGSVDTYTNFGFAGPTYGASYGYSMTSVQTIYKNVTAADEYYVECDFRIGSDDTKRNYVHLFNNAGTQIAEIMFDSNAAAGTVPIRAYNRVTSAQIAVGSTQFTVGTWHKVKARIVIGATTGICQVWVDGTLEIDESGLNLGTNQISRVGFGSTGGQQTKYIDNPVIATDDLTSGPRYVAACTTTLNANSDTRVWEDDVDMGNIESAALDVDGSGKWFIDDSNDLIYLQATDDLAPDTHTIEIAERDHCIRSNNESYIKITGFTLKRSKNTALLFGGSTSAAVELYADNNTIDQSGYGGVAVTYDVDGATVEENTITRAHHAGIYANLADAGGDVPRNLTIRKNNISNCKRQGIALENNGGVDAYLNIIYDINTDGTYARGIEVGLITTGTTVNIYNNTVYDTEDENFYVRSFDGTAVINNNIFRNSGAECIIASSGATTSSLTLDYNAIFRAESGETMITWGGSSYTQPNFSTFQSASSQETNGVSLDPTLNSQWRPTTNTSTFFTGGTDVSLTEDFYNITQSDDWIGAVGKGTSLTFKKHLFLH